MCVRQTNKQTCKDGHYVSAALSAASPGRLRSPHSPHCCMTQGETGRRRGTERNKKRYRKVRGKDDSMSMPLSVRNRNVAAGASLPCTMTLLLLYFLSPSTPFFSSHALFPIQHQNLHFSLCSCVNTKHPDI